LDLILADIKTQKGDLFQVKRIENENESYFMDLNPPMKIVGKEWFSLNNESFPCDLWK